MRRPIGSSSWLFLLLATALLSTGCGSDDTSLRKTKTGIEGGADECADGFVMTGDVCSPVAHPECPYLPAELAVTKPPIRMEYLGFTEFLNSKTDPAALADLLDEIKIDAPEVHAEAGNSLVPFLWGSWKGTVNEVYGDSASDFWGNIVDHGILPPDKMQQRIDALKNYLPLYAGWTKFFPYTDFGTQIFGNHRTRTGFWAFYDRWDEFNAAFNLGDKPPDPTTWLKSWVDKGKASDKYPDGLEGLSFAYGPAKCSYDSGACRATYSPPDCSNDKARPVNCSQPTYYRYALNILSKGWEMWWKMSFQTLARIGYPGAFIDNVYFSSCWNKECDDAYRAWVTSNVAPGDLSRFSSGASSLYMDPGFEWGWNFANGVWTTNYSSVTGDAKIFPDADAVAGLYSARIEGAGVFQTITSQVPADKLGRDIELTVHYKTRGDAKVTINLLANGTYQKLPLDNASAWTAKTITIRPTSADVALAFQVEAFSPSPSAPPTLWLDEIWMREPGTGTDAVANIHLPTEEELFSFGGRLKAWAWNKANADTVNRQVTFIRDAARQINPNFQLYTNSYHPVRGADYFMVEGQAEEFEVPLQEVGSDPGVFRPASSGPAYTLNYAPVKSEVVVTNLFDYKENHSLRFPDFFSYASHLGHGLPSYYAHNADSILLKYAEVAAFGGGAGADPELVANYTAYPDKAGLLALHDIGRKFFAFVGKHKDLYECLQPQADVALIYHDVPSREDSTLLLKFSEALASKGVLWDVIADEKKITASNLARYKILVYQSVQRLPDSEAKLLKDFMTAGGVVVAAGITGQYDQFFRLRATNSTFWPPAAVNPKSAQTVPVGSGVFVSLPAGLSDADVDPFLRTSETQLKRPLSVFASLSGTDLARMRVASWSGYKKMVMHFVNYNVPLGPENAGQVKTLTDIEVRVKPMPGMTPSSVTLYSPESSSTNGVVPFTTTEDGTIRFTIPALRIYDVAVIE